MEKKMNKAAITKHEIYNKLIGFSEQDLAATAGYLDLPLITKDPEIRESRFVSVLE